MRRLTPYLTAAALTVALGLFTRSKLFEFPRFVTEYLGDSLWSMLVYFLLACGLRSTRPWKIATSALTLSTLIELSQLYQATWINELRDNSLAALVLGHGFRWSDQVCYTVGIILAWLVDLLIARKRQIAFS